MVMKIFILITSFIVLVSCFGVRDVTFDPSFRIGYKKGDVYQNLEKMFIVDDRNPYLVIPGESFPAISKYEKNKNDYKEIDGVLDIGNSLMIERLLYRRGFEGSYLDVFAVILDGDHAGKEVRLNLVSKIDYKPYPEGGTIPVPDPSLMKLIEN